MKKYFAYLLFLGLLCISFGCSQNSSNKYTATYSDTRQTETNNEQQISTIDENLISSIVANGIDKINELKNQHLIVHFIDVGQADAALIMSQGQSMLIDGGNVGDSSLIYSYLTQHKIKHLNCIIGTHAHEDHMGGLSGALVAANVDKIFAPSIESDAKFYLNFKEKVAENGLQITNPDSGYEFKLGECNVMLLCPEIIDNNNINNTSIIVKITYGKTSFLFMGDAEREEELDILNQGYDISATVLKVGHHGSDTSSSYIFLNEVMPSYAVISVGKNNQHGHPNEAVLSRFNDLGATVYRTDYHSDIIASSDGENVFFQTQKGR